MQTDKDKIDQVLEDARRGLDTVEAVANGLRQAYRVAAYHVGRAFGALVQLGRNLRKGAR